MLSWNIVVTIEFFFSLLTEEMLLTCLCQKGRNIMIRGKGFLKINSSVISFKSQTVKMGLSFLVFFFRKEQEGTQQIYRLK